MDALFRWALPTVDLSDDEAADGEGAQGERTDRESAEGVGADGGTPDTELPQSLVMRHRDHLSAVTPACQSMNTGIPSQKKRSGRPQHRLRHYRDRHRAPLLPFRFKWIANRESLDLLPVLQILRVQNATAVLERASQLQRIVDLITIALRKGERALVRGNRERLDFAQGADGAELFVDSSCAGLVC